MVLEYVLGMFNPKKKSKADSLQESKAEFRMRAAKLREDLTDLNVGEKSVEFFGLVHQTFTKLMDLPTSTTYTELKAVVKESSRLRDDIKKSLLEFLNEVEHLEYDFPEFVDDQEIELAREKDAAIRYLQHLMKNSDTAAKKKLVELNKIILADEPVNARKIIETYLSKFEQILDAFKV